MESCWGEGSGGEKPSFTFPMVYKMDSKNYKHGFTIGKFDDEFFFYNEIGLHNLALKAIVIYGYHPDKIW